MRYKSDYHVCLNAYTTHTSVFLVLEKVGFFDIFFAFLQFAEEQKRHKKRGKAVTENLVRIAITVVKSKCAAQHYETMVAAHSSTGSDVGELNHSRKQFIEILRAVEVWTDREISKFLMNPLPSTRLPPHFFVTLDKSTPQRVTNQAVLICPVVNGHREAIAVSSPAVYYANQDGNNPEGNVSGGLASQLADRAYNEVRNSYPSPPEAVIQSRTWTVCRYT